eukprot:scaffold359216_cov17-Prasinocladus_malaysianus.AAC.1
MRQAGSKADTRTVNTERLPGPSAQPIPPRRASKDGKLDSPTEPQAATTSQVLHRIEPIWHGRVVVGWLHGRTRLQCADVFFSAEQRTKGQGNRTSNCDKPGVGGCCFDAILGDQQGPAQRSQGQHSRQAGSARRACECLTSELNPQQASR